MPDCWVCCIINHSDHSNTYQQCVHYNSSHYVLVRTLAESIARCNRCKFVIVAFKVTCEALRNTNQISSEQLKMLCYIVLYFVKLGLLYICV